MEDIIKEEINEKQVKGLARYVVNEFLLSEKSKIPIISLYGADNQILIALEEKMRDYFLHKKTNLTVVRGISTVNYCVNVGYWINSPEYLDRLSF